ncbi:MAG: hypothetical protein ACYC6Y_23675 [Thermoguttaceae bacterium]
MDPRIDEDAVTRRIDMCLVAVEELLAIFDDGIEHWDDVLPEFTGSPRRWPLDNKHLFVVGDVLLSRYGGYDWWVLDEMTKYRSSLERAYRHNRMSEGQRDRYLRSLESVRRLRPKAIELGLVYDWRKHPIAPRLIERCPDHPSVRFIRIAEQSHPPEPAAEPDSNGQPSPPAQ